MNPRRVRSEHGLGGMGKQMNQAESSGKTIDAIIVTIVEPPTADKKTPRCARPDSFVGEKIYSMPVTKSPVNVPYAITDNRPQIAPISAPLEEISFHSVRRTGMTVAAASKSAKRNIWNTPPVSKADIPISGMVKGSVGPVAR